MTNVWKPMFRLALGSLMVPLLWLSVMAGPETREAPNMAAVPVNQLPVAGNACGPAALLNAFRFGNSDWQRASNNISGENDRERVLTVIREIGMRPSKSVPGRPRWSRRGVNVADLCDMANEMTADHWLPQISEEMCYLKAREMPESLLKRIHSRMQVSLAKGLPPILSIRRHALRVQAGQASQWTSIDAHFITIISVPNRLEKNARTFPVRYIDPWGGRICEGEIRIPVQAILPDANGRSSCLEALFPQTSVGAKLVRRGDLTVIVPAAIIGRR
jgi:hypothetical protein